MKKLVTLIAVGLVTIIMAGCSHGGKHCDAPPPPPPRHDMHRHHDNHFHNHHGDMRHHDRRMFSPKEEVK